MPYWSGHPGVFAALLSDLGRDHRIVTWDARGTGESTRTGPYDVETDSADLEAVLERVGEAAAVIGVANGCNGAVRIAGRRPDLVRSAIAFGAGPFARLGFAGSESMIASDSVVAAFLGMLQRDYRGALRTVLSATNAQMSEGELRDRIDFQLSYCPQEAAIDRVKAWADDDPREPAVALGDRLWILSAPAIAGQWLPPLEERLQIIHSVTPGRASGDGERRRWAGLPPGSGGRGGPAGHRTARVRALSRDQTSFSKKRSGADRRLAG